MSEDDLDSKKMEKLGEAKDEPDSLQSRLSRWLRRIIIFILILLMLFLVAWFGLVGPRAAEITQLQADLATAHQQIEELEGQNTDLQSLKAQRSILSLLSDANLARFELARNNKVAASAALLNTGNTLYQLSLELDEEFDETIQSLETRLSLAREGIQSDSDISSLNDLEVFVNTLQNLLQSLLSE